jgi:PII-like signaling protein
MIETIRRRRIEVLVDAPLARRIINAAHRAGIAGYTLLPTLEGKGRGGHWSDDQISGAQSKQLFLSVTSEEKAAAFVEAVAPLLDSHGLLLLLSDVDVVRGTKF